MRALIEPRQQHVTEEHGPHAVAHLLEPDRQLLEGIAQEEEAVAESERARRGDLANEEVPRILNRR